MTIKDFRERTRLNGICPYFTMFPLTFPYDILKSRAESDEWIADPFCGRGTTNYAARILGLPSIGIDSSPVAVAISEAKLANATPKSIIRAAKRILDSCTEPDEIPEGEFWTWAFHPNVLHTLCRLREGMLADCRSQGRKALRAVILGALHGPRPKTKVSYFSNQMPRTYAPKPRYAVKYWKSHCLDPELVDVLQLIKERAVRYYAKEKTTANGKILLGDSRASSTFQKMETKVSWVITSPPYYGLYTYLPDQWLRLWFLGGPSSVAYTRDGQLKHSSREKFSDDLRQVWKNVGRACQEDAQMIVRFGGINNRKADPLHILRESFKDSGWEIFREETAGNASAGKRQAIQHQRTMREAREEHDVWAVWID